MRLEPVLQRHRETVGKEGNQDVRIHPTLQLMVDRSNAQIALQTFEGRFDLRQLHVSIPQYRWIFGYQVRAQQIVAIPELSFFQLDLVELKCERLPRHRLARLGQVDLHESESPPYVR